MSDYKPLRPGKGVARGTLLHPEFEYVQSHKTNIAATFARVRAEQAAKPANVRAMKARGK